ncbi:MAG: cytochrome c oxidase accessory protein CcoG, partial [Bacteroidetes bacterium]|nr:cytochrome c oxidase accessory protein CcoG [Bacteroidota bacterium]
ASIYKADGNPIVVPAEGLAKSVYFIKIPQDKILQAKTVVEVSVFHKEKQIEKLKVKFIGPVPSSVKH